MLRMTQIDNAATAELFNVLTDALMETGADRSTAISGLLAVLAVQVRGQMMPMDDLMMFVHDASQWSWLYLNPIQGPIQ